MPSFMKQEVDSSMTPEPSNESELQVTSFPAEFKKTHLQKPQENESERPCLKKEEALIVDSSEIASEEAKNGNNSSIRDIAGRSSVQGQECNSTSVSSQPTGKTSDGPEPEDSGRERLKRHRVEVAGRVWIPDIWGQEELLKDWIDCTAFDASLRSSNIMSARAALVEEGRRATSNSIRIENSC